MLKVARDNLVKYAADPMTGISQLFTNVPKSQGEIPNPSVSEDNNAPNDSSRKECEFSDTANNRTLWQLCVCVWAYLHPMTTYVHDSIDCLMDYFVFGRCMYVRMYIQWNPDTFSLWGH